MNTIANTTVISNFAVISRLDLLQRLFGRLHVSVDVYSEIIAGLEEGYRFYAGIDQQIHQLAEDGWIHLVSLTGPEELDLYTNLPSRLHSGEASSIAIASQRGWLFLTDDRAARQEATRRHIALSGTIGCLTIAVERNLLTPEEADTALARLIQQGYRSPVSEISSLLTL